MKELVELQQALFKVAAQAKDLEKRVIELESKMGQDVVAMRAEAKAVLDKATALVNPYSSHTMTHDPK